MKANLGLEYNSKRRSMKEGNEKMIADQLQGQGTAARSSTGNISVGPSGPLRGFQVGGAQFLQFFERFREVREERGLILGVYIDVLLEFGILDQRQVGGEHHELLAPVLVLERAGPIPLRPVDLLQEREVQVVERGRGGRPRPVVSRRGRVAPSEGVRAAERDDLPIVESHAVEYRAEVDRVGRVGPRGAGVGVREAAVGGHRGRVEGVDPAGTGFV